MSNWGTIAVGTRIGEGRCDPLFFRSWTKLVIGGLRVGDGALDPAVELPHHMAANVLVRQFLRSSADTLCMIDSDMVFDSDTLSKLRDDPTGEGYDMLSALCVVRRKPFAPVLLRVQERPDGQKEYRCHEHLIDGGIVDVDAIGLPFAMIRRTVFDRLSGYAPWWFDWGERGLGEDTNFSQRAIAAGCRLGVHTGVGIEHRGTIGFKWDVENKKTVMCSFDQVGELIKT